MSSGTLREHLKSISYIDPSAPDPFLHVTPQGLFECKVCFCAYANERRYRDHTKTDRHRQLIDRGLRRK